MTGMLTGDSQTKLIGYHVGRSPRLGAGWGHRCHPKATSGAASDSRTQTRMIHTIALDLLILLTPLCNLRRYVEGSVRVQQLDYPL